jgi:4-amino-4-deoxy-L-arabinose transferase-like glycosyltransferase
VPAESAPADDDQRVDDAAHTPRISPQLYILPAAFAATNILLLWTLGIRKSGDARRYIESAERLNAGLPLSLKQSSYIAYDVIVATSLRTGTGLAGVVMLQILAAGLASYALYRLGSALAGRTAGLLASLLYVMNPDIQRWNCYILTDSLYISLVVVSCWCIYSARQRGRVGFVVAIAVTLLAALLRPNGWLLPPIAALYWLWTGQCTVRTRALITSAGVIACVLAVTLVPPLRSRIQEEQPYEMLLRGEIVWGWSDRLWMPQETRSGGDWVEGLSYAWRHPADVTRLVVVRMAVEAAHVRPFYSRMHNVLLIVYLVPLYFAAAAGAIRFRGPVVWLIGAIVAAHFGVVALTFADWDGRFLLYVLPPLSILAAAALAARVNALILL